MKIKGAIMPSTATVKVKIESELKNEVEKIFQNLGLTPMEAINLFYRMVKLEKTLPFEAKIPNDETLQAIEDAEKRQNLTECDDVNDLMRKLRA
ncbi:type II toxin-antitoxin system RelB/DinJ family antitoxin [bacterium]|nr:type II toxin-antitoxin system RelB/DinJ family antitoxin [bacterium]